MTTTYRGLTVPSGGDQANLPAAVTALVDTLFPVGYMAMWPTTTPPAGWLLCTGAAIPVGAAYDALRTLIGANTPNLAGRVPGGPGGSLSSTLLATGGAATVTLGVGEIPSHTHDISHTHAGANTSLVDLHHVHTFPGGQVPVIAGSGLGGGLGGGTLGTPISYTNDGTPTVGAADLAHYHTVNIPTFSGSSGAGTGGNGAHANIQPYTVVNFIIKY